MGMLLSSFCAQECQALWDHENPVTRSIKEVIGGSLALSSIALAVLSGGYGGGIVVSALTYNYYRRKEGAKIESFDLRRSMVIGGFAGALIGGYVATALSVNALAVL